MLLTKLAYRFVYAQRLFVCHAVCMSGGGTGTLHIKSEASIRSYRQLTYPD